MWPRSLVGRRPTDICEARVRIPSKCESYQAFFSAIAFTAAFLQISYLKFYNYGNLISRVLNFAIVVRRYFAGLHIRDFNARPATIERRHAMRTNFFFGGVQIGRFEKKASTFKVSNKNTFQWKAKKTLLFSMK